MNLMFEWQDIVRANMWCSFDYIKVNDDGFFDDFPKISDPFPKISKDFPKLFRRPAARSRTFSENLWKFMNQDVQRFPKIAEDIQGRPKDVSMTYQRI